jgi:hypothetical protein
LFALKEEYKLWLFKDRLLRRISTEEVKVGETWQNEKCCATVETTGDHIRELLGRVERKQ